MSENGSEPTPAPTTGNPSATAPTSGAEPWKAGAHSRFAGRTPDEILGIAEGLASVAERFNQPVPQPVPQTNRFDLDIPDDQYIEGRHVKQILANFANQPAPIDYIGRQQSAQALLAGVRIERADEFKRWGSEIQAELNKLDPSYWTVDNLNTVVNIVKSRHIDELAAEKAQRLVDESHPTIRSGSGGSGSVPQVKVTLDSEAIPQDWSQAAKAVGLSEKDVREFCQMAGISVEQYMADLTKYGKSGVIRGD